MKINDLVWTRDSGDIYHLARVNGPWPNAPDSRGNKMKMDTLLATLVQLRIGEPISEGLLHLFPLRIS